MGSEASEGSGEKLDSRWIGPGLVKGREGERSYIIEIKSGIEIKSHRSFDEIKSHRSGVPSQF